MTYIHVYKNIGKFFLLLVLLLSSALPSQPALCKELSEQEIKTLIQQTLQNNPDLVLDVLRDNSEVVLEIAQQGNLQRKRRAMISQWLQDIKEPKQIDMAGAAFFGSATAPVTIVAFSDFTCSYCRQAEEVLQTILAKYPQEVRMVFMPLPNEENPVSVLAAKYATAAFKQDMQKGWKFYRTIFAGAERLEIDGDNFFKQAAIDAGLDITKLMAQVNSNDVLSFVQNTRKQADKLGVQGTPYFFVNDLVIRGAVPKEFFEEAIQMALKKP